MLMFLMVGHYATAQVSRSLYFMDHLPAANTLNPSFSPPNNVVIDIPLISSMNIAVNAPFSYTDMTQESIADDKLQINKLGILSAMDEVGTLSLNMQMMMGRVGIRSNKHFFTFDVSKILDVDVSLEKDLVEFLLYGNGSEDFLGKELNLSKTGFKGNMYHQFALGYTLDYSPKLSFGVRAKYLNGILNAWTEKADLNVYTDPNDNYALSASTDILVHTAAAYGYLEDLNFSNPMDYVMVKLTQNHGFAADFGVTYRPMEKVVVSASVIDLGAINWKTNVKSYQSKHANETYTFNGFELSELLNGGSIADSITILDSLNEHFSIENTYTPYSSPLTPTAYLGGAYNITPNDQFGLLIRARFPQEEIQTSYTVNYRRKFGDVFTGVVNYTFREHGNQIGLGVSVRAGAVNIYAMTDMFRSMIEPTEAQGYNIHFGISLAFGKPYRDEEPAENGPDQDPLIPPDQNTGGNTTE